MGDGLVGAMVAAMRRANREWASASRAAAPRPAPQPDGAVTSASSTAERGRRAERHVAGTDSAGAAWGYLTHPALLPTVFSRSDECCEEVTGTDVAERKV